MIKRQLQAELELLRKQYSILAIMGPRQSGKTILAKACFTDLPYISLEDPDERALAAADPRGFLQRYKHGAILDEAHNLPLLFSYLQTHVDENPTTCRFVLTGSQNFLLHEKISQSLAGRIAIVTLMPLSLSEIKASHAIFTDLDTCLLKGAYPRLYHEGIDARKWQKNYIKTYLERDVRQIKNITDLGKFQVFLTMCAHRIGQLLNLSALAQDCGITHNTAKEWVSLLEASYLVFLLRPHHRNFQKRLVKMPKLYFYDTGIVSALLNLDDSIATNPIRGHLFENFVISEMMKTSFNRGVDPQLYFWRDHAGHEVDVVQEQGQDLIPYEIKSGQTLTPDSFKPLNNWMKLSGTPRGNLIYGGDKSFIHKEIAVYQWNKEWYESL
ncbi:MAG: ATP-binding protein [Alphaproteobacteria bacterium]